MRLDRLLIAHGVITAEQAASAETHMLEHNCRFGEALVALGILDEHKVSIFVGEQQRMRAPSLFAKSRAVLQMMRSAARSVATR
jgi:hypothetical protein